MKHVVWNAKENSDDRSGYRINETYLEEKTLKNGDNRSNKTV
jgi:hypothetical protein